jgi:hypothetical protein
MKEHFLKIFKGKERPQQEGTHYVLFLVDDQAFASDNLDKEHAEELSKLVNGMVVPVDLKPGD